MDAIAGFPACDCDGYGLYWYRHDGRCELKKAIIRVVFATTPCVTHDCGHAFEAPCQQLRQRELVSPCDGFEPYYQSPVLECRRCGRLRRDHEVAAGESDRSTAA